MGSTGMQMEQVIERLTQEPTKSRRLQTECIDGDEEGASYRAPDARADKVKTPANGVY